MTDDCAEKNPVVKKSSRHWKMVDLSRPLGVALVILSVLTVSAAAYSVQKSRDTQDRQQVAIDYNRAVLDCQNAYSEANSDALEARTAASAVDRRASAKDREAFVAADDSITRLLDQIKAAGYLPLSEQKAKADQIYREYVIRQGSIDQLRRDADDLRAEAEKSRKENPLPSATCPNPKPMDTTTGGKTS